MALCAGNLSPMDVTALLGALREASPLVQPMVSAWLPPENWRRVVFLVPRGGRSLGTEFVRQRWKGVRYWDLFHKNDPPVRGGRNKHEHRLR